MPYNRLRLDWGISTRDERNQFLIKYLPSLTFTPNEHELETLSNYLLWGTNAEGLNGRQEGLELETAHKTWDTQDTESLDALLESPTFSESMLRRPEDPIYKTPRPNFSRAEARAQAPKYVLEALEAIWKRMDELELITNFYDLQNGRRKTAIRQLLLAQFTPAQQHDLEMRASKLTLRQYLQMRHTIVEMRREQYTLKDTYAEPRQTTPTFNTYDNSDFSPFDAIDILPLGLPDSSFARRLFPPTRMPVPSDFSDTDLKELSNLIWKPRTQKTQLNFTNPTHLYQISEQLTSILNTTDNPSDTLLQVKELFDYYVSLARLKPHQRIILDMKLAQASNQAISDAIYTQLGHRYTLNYISTIYCKSIIPLIAQAAQQHYETCQNLFFPENFKTCIDCGRVLLRNESNFMHKAKVKDGFAPRCKECERIKRENKKGEQK